LEAAARSLLIVASQSARERVGAGWGPADAAEGVLWSGCWLPMMACASLPVVNDADLRGGKKEVMVPGLLTGGAFAALFAGLLGARGLHVSMSRKESRCRRCVEPLAERTVGTVPLL